MVLTPGGERSIKPQPWKSAMCEQGTRSRLPVLENRSPVGVLRNEVVVGMGGSQIPRPQNSQTLIVLVYILGKIGIRGKIEQATKIRSWFLSNN